MLTTTVFFVQDEATGITHHLVPGDFAFFHVGSKVKVCCQLRPLSSLLLPYLSISLTLTFQFSTKSSGFAFYAVTRPVRNPHSNLQGREEGTSKL